MFLRMALSIESALQVSRKINMFDKHSDGLQS